MRGVRKDDFLYIFLHVPKCAGTSFIRTVTLNLPMIECLMVNPSLEKPYQRKDNVEAMLESLSRERKNRIRFVYGHAVYYGIHRHFDRAPRYVTFLRHPISQIISNYEHVRKHFSLFHAEGMQKLPPKVSEFTFDWWWHHGPRNIQTAMLLNYQRDNQAGWNPRGRIGANDTERAARLLSKFYFVGLHETFEEDALFLYSRLGVRRVLRQRQNVSRLSSHPRALPDEATMARGLASDMALYARAADLNTTFKHENTVFKQTVVQMHEEAIRVTPLRYRLIDGFERLLGQKLALQIIEGTVSLVKRLIGTRTSERLMAFVSRFRLDTGRNGHVP